MLDCHLRVVHKLINGVDSSADVVLVRIERMPVVHVVELEVDAIIIVVTVSKQQIGFVDQFEVVVGKMVDIVFDHYLDKLTYI